MNNTAIDYTARLAAAHRADVASGIAASRAAHRVRELGELGEPTVTEVPSPRRRGWSRWMPAPRPAL